ncbi:MAG: Hsp20/alpha crystallin family protein [bacterium]|nr:Hsp20/alpha crystallin family protein [bacterium]
MTLFPHRRDFDPVNALLRLQRDLDSASDNPVGFDLGISGRGVYPPINVFRDADGLAIRMEVPGFAHEQLTIETRGQTLIVSGKPDETELASGSYHRRERPAREFSRSLQLPRDIDPVDAKATCKNGVLTVRIPLREEVKPREIQVTS